MAGEHIIRHRLLSRLLHWLMALSILVLLATGLLPPFGVKFAWLAPHWIAGLALSALIALHIVRALIVESPRSMGLGLRDLRAFLGGLGIARRSAPKPGKYTLPQKMMHHAVAITGLAAVGTGLLMLRKIDTPFWHRAPGLMSEADWGIVYALHDLAAFLFVTLILLHLYFTLRPEKLFYLRSMIFGWITPGELAENHDPGRWPPQQPGARSAGDK